MELFLIFLFLSQSLLLYMDYFVKDFKFADPIHIAILAYFFFIIGIIAARNKEAISLFVRKWKYILLFIMFGSGVYVFYEGFARFLATGNYLAYYSQWRPSVLIYTVLIGLVSFYLFEKNKLQFSLIEKLSRLSFLVFLIHVIVIEVVWSVFGKNLFLLFKQNLIGKVIFDPVFFLIVAGISFFLAFLLHKISKLYKLVG